jgi:hypothetical protein
MHVVAHLLMRWGRSKHENIDNEILPSRVDFLQSWISGMVPSAGTENLIAQLYLENLDDDIQCADFTNRIN